MNKVLNVSGIVQWVVQGILTVIPGIIALSVWIEQTFRFEPLVFIWPMWFGIVFYLRSEQMEPSLEPIPAS
jgi:uncharacterized membrane protein YhdT